MFLNTDNLADGEITLTLTATQEADPAREWVPTYCFGILRAIDGVCVGRCCLRVGWNRKIFFGGHIGYFVVREHRGYHYAGKACRLLFTLARRHGMVSLTITCNPDNAASRRTCEYVGGVLADIVELPEDNDMYLEGERKSAYIGLICRGEV